MSLKPELFIDSRNTLGEGPFWHEARQQLFWFDITPGLLLCADTSGRLVKTYQFDQPVAAAALIDAQKLAILAATGLVELDLDTNERTEFLPIEADDPRTRGNDSRVSPQGAWWIGTMDRTGQGQNGNVYHYYKGKLSTIRNTVGIPNATSFSPDGKTAYFADSPTRRILKVALDPETGMPVGEWEVFVDKVEGGGVPDGAVVDVEGCLWNAEHGNGRITRYTPDGKIDQQIALPVSQPTCPCFGGPDLKTLYITSAKEGLSDEALAAQPHAGSVFVLEPGVAGQPETPLQL